MKNKLNTELLFTKMHKQYSQTIKHSLKFVGHQFRPFYYICFSFYTVSSEIQKFVSSRVRMSVVCS